MYSLHVQNILMTKASVYAYSYLNCGLKLHTEYRVWYLWQRQQAGGISNNFAQCQDQYHQNYNVIVVVIC